MSDVYVDSNATGASSGASWSDAHATIAAGYGNSAWGDGDTLFVASDHAETIGNTTLETGGDSVDRKKIVTWNTSSDVYQSMDDGGGSITLTGTWIKLQGSSWIEGLKVETTNGDVIPTGTAASIDLVDCLFDCGTTGDYLMMQSNDVSVRVRSSTIKGTSSVFSSSQEAVFDFIDCSFIGHSNGTHAVNLADANSAYFRCCEISAGNSSQATVDCGNANSHCLDIVFEDCELPKDISSVTLSDRKWGRVSSNRTGTGLPSLTSELYRSESEGIVETVSAPFRDAVDVSGDSYSLKLVASSTASDVKPLELRLLVPVSASDTSIKIHFAYTSTEVSDSSGVFAHCVSPNESNGFQGAFRTTFVPCGTMASFSSSSGWTGSGFNSQGAIEFDVSPTYAGQAEVRFCVAKAATVYVCPAVEVS